MSYLSNELNFLKNKIQNNFILNPKIRILWLKWTTAGSFIIGLLLSIRLWVGDEFFPSVPVLKNIPAIPSVINTLLFLFLVGFLVGVIVSSNPKKFIFSALFIIGIFAFFDQMRWQPWVYQYSMMMVVLTLCVQKNTSTKKRELALDIIGLMMISIYFYSGLQKINPLFVNDIFPWFIEPLLNIFSFNLSNINSLAVLVPVFEVSIAIGLFTKKFRNYAVVLAILMFLFNLFTLGPWGHNFNIVVWPWNIAMIFFTILLFWNRNSTLYKNILNLDYSYFYKTILILFLIMPMFSFFNFWDSYLSWSLYSGNTDNAVIYIDNETKRNLPDNLNKYIKTIDEDNNKIDLQKWSFLELNVPVYPETRVYKKIANDLCEYTKKEGGIRLKVRERLHLLQDNEKRLLRVHNCREL